MVSAMLVVYHVWVITKTVMFVNPIIYMKKVRNNVFLPAVQQLALSVHLRLQYTAINVTTDIFKF